jgi:hypothetical protein
MAFATRINKKARRMAGLSSSGGFYQSPSIAVAIWAMAYW